MGDRARQRALLLLHLLLVLLYHQCVLVAAIGDVYRPSGLRTKRVDAERGRAWVEAMLYGHRGRVKDVTLLPREVFVALVAWLRANTRIRDGDLVSVEEKVLIFLLIVTQGSTNRVAAEMFQHSGRSISKAFHEVLDGLLQLYKEQVVQPTTESEVPFILTEPKNVPFGDCLGALDGTHVPIHVSSKANAALYRNRKQVVSQNVLAIVDFDMNFLFVLAGWEGSAHDSKVLNSALDHGLKVPEGRYYLGDAGYSSRMKEVLVPYQKVRYHLREHFAAARRPATKEELFNLRHASLRNVVERTFAVFKARFKILATPRQGLALSTQVRLVVALAALHNFMNRNGCSPEEEVPKEGNATAERDEEATYVNSGGEVVERRDRIATTLFEQYLSHVTY